MKIVLDFDDCIFNTYQFFQELLGIFKRVGFTEKEFFDNHRRTKEKNGYFNLEMIIEFLYQTKRFNKEKIKEEIRSFMDKSGKFVYSDFAGFAGNFGKENLILLSYGDANFQKEKIEKSGIASFFKEIIITRDKAKSFKTIFQKYNAEKIFFIDDKADQVNQIKKYFPQVVAIKIERPQGKHIEIKSELADYVVGNLDEAKDKINMIMR